MEIVFKDFIETPTISCHSGAVTYFKDERLTSWFGGDVEGACNTDIYLQKGDLSAYPLNVNWNFLPAWNPVFVQVAKKLFLFFKVGKFCDSWQTFYMEYKDGRFDRTTIRKLPAGLNGPVKTPPVVSKNTVMFGSSVETWNSWAAYIEVYDFQKGEFIYTERTGPLWTPDEKIGLIQPSLIVDDRGLTHGFFRAKMSGKIWYGSDKTGFKTLMPLCEGPNSSVSAVYHEGFAYLACNSDPVGRLPLSILKIALTKSGPDIRGTLDLETDVDFERYEVVNKVVDYPNGSFDRVIGTTAEASYPYMIVNPDGHLEVVYTYGRRGMKRAIVKV